MRAAGGTVGCLAARWGTVRNGAMRVVKLTLVLLVLLLLGGLTHYALPRHEVVRIVGVETRLESFGINRIFFASAPGGSAEGGSRDVRYVETLRPDGSERVFRNEDTGWGWPPFFKMNAADVQARARDMISSGNDPRWVRIGYYGVRSRMLSAYPNLLSLRAVDSPSVEEGLPWLRIVGFAVVGMVALWLWLVLRRFRTRRFDPFMARLGARTRRLRDRFSGRDNAE